MEREKKDLSHTDSRGRPTLSRVNALAKHSTYIVSDHLDDNRDPFRIEGDEGVSNLLNRLGITRPDMLGIDSSEWEARMSRPSSGELSYGGRHPEEDIPKRAKSMDIARMPHNTLRRMSLDSAPQEATVRPRFSPLSTVSSASDGGIQASLVINDRSIDSLESMGSRSSDSMDDSQSSSQSELEDHRPILTTRLSCSSWKKLDLLGSGSFGSVYRSIGSNGHFFAVKEVSLLSAHEDSAIQLQQEIDLLMNCQHENIVQYLGTERDQDKLYIFLELVTQGSLASQYRSYPLFEEQIRTYTRQILNGLKYLHDRKVVHRDIKCANILVHVNATVKLADFGMAKQLENIDSMRSCKGSAYWMAPEVINPRKTSSFPADIWSLGCTVLEMATGRPPFSDLEWNTVMWKVGHGEIPPISEYLHEDARDFISKCLQVEPSKRPTAAQLLDHPFVRPNPTALVVSHSQLTEVTYDQQGSNTRIDSSLNASVNSATPRSVRSVRTRQSIFEKRVKE